MSMLSHSLTWAAVRGRKTAASVTRGRLKLNVPAEVWGTDDAFEWTWVDLLDWLGSNWLFIASDDGLPFGVDPRNVGELTGWVQLESRNESDRYSEELEMRLWEFREAHDLSRALAGALAPGVIVWREGLTGHVLTDSDHLRVEWQTVEAMLVQLGDEICTRLSLASEDPRANSVRAAWQHREASTEEDVVHATPDLADEIKPVVLELMARPLGRHRISDFAAHNEILAAARMSTPLPAEAVDCLLREISSVEKRNLDPVEEFSARVMPDLDIMSAHKWYEQGYWVAQLVRLALGANADERLDVMAWLADHDVFYREIQLPTKVIDALAVWGPAHGPAVLVNTRGEHAATPSGRNISVAHEIGHILMDRHGALPAVEVLGGRVNESIEARARAFAAELLLPRSVAGGALAGPHVSRAVDLVVSSLSNRFGVSHEVVAWQARNSGIPLTQSTHATLRKKVSRPGNF